MWSDPISFFCRYFFKTQSFSLGQLCLPGNMRPIHRGLILGGLFLAATDIRVSGESRKKKNNICMRIIMYP